MAEILKVDPVHPDPNVLERAALILRAGGIVAFPTETVYGLGADEENPEAIARLRSLKGREASKPFSVHLPGTQEVLARVERVPGPARKLMDRYWPGPLTLVLAARGGGEVGFRVPSGAVPRGFLAACGRGVLAPSANRAGEPPPTDAAGVFGVFGDRIDAILDGGPSPLRQSSTVVRVAHGAIEVLREGILSRPQVYRTACRSVLFICTGNSCRSPMAEGILKRKLADRLRLSPGELPARGYQVGSAGVCAGWGPASDQAIAAAREWNADLSEHVARQLTPEMLRESDLAFAMTRLHLDRATEICPEAAGRIHLLDPAGGEVADPVWGTLEVYQTCARELERLVELRMDMILEGD